MLRISFFFSSFFRSALILIVSAIHSPATAHVKWFAPYSLADAPKALDLLLAMPIFWVLLVGITSLMLIATWMEKRRLADKVIRSLNALTFGMRHRLDDMMRVGTGAFLLALWVMGGVILTPELKTDKLWVSWLQLGMSLALFWRMTMPLTAIGIVFLWGLGVSQYGLFHLLDYPIFLGIAIYLMMSAWPKSAVFPYRWDVLRWGAAITLMWASIEKFAYPEWSFPVLDAMPVLTLGLSNADFMILAGLAEFALAFALIWTPLVCRLSALFLCVLFTSAIVLFGKIDAVGHLMIILILISIIVNDRHVSFRFQPIEKIVPLKLASLVVFTAAFYSLQATFYGNVTVNADLNSTHDGPQAERVEVNATDDMSTLHLGTEQPDPVLGVYAARGDDQIWRLFLITENFILSAPEASMAESMPVGHVHIYSGEEKLAAAYSPVVELDMLEPGRHRLTVVLYSSDHRMLLGRNGPIARDVLVEVPFP